MDDIATFACKLKSVTLLVDGGLICAVEQNGTLGDGER